MANPVAWFEIMGPDPEQTSKFYSELFGWQTQALEGGYTTVDTSGSGGINGGLGKSDDGQTSLKVYALVDDLQGSLDKAGTLGGSTVVPVTEMSVVTFAQFSDPAGNVVGLIPPPADPSTATGPSQGDGAAVDWFEILGPDPKALWSFYRDLFGWDIHEGGTEEFKYGEVHGEGIGGGIGSSPDGAPHTNVYAHVDDLQKYLERAESLGGKTVMRPTDMQNIAFAMFADPQGTTFGLWASKES